MAFPSILPPEAAQVLNLNQQLQTYESLPAIQQKAIQTRSLQALFAWAHAHSPFWRERLDAVGWTRQAEPRETLGRLLPLTRADLQTHFDALSCAHAFAADSCFEAKTTGSTGQPVRALKHHASYNLRYHAFALRSTLWHQLNASKPLLRLGVRVEDGVAANWGMPEAWYFKTGPLILVRSLERDVTEMYTPIKQHRPSYLVANASVATALANYALQHDAHDRPRLAAILTTGETVNEQLRANCQAAFGAKLINRYSCEEIGWLALQCPKHDHLHVLNANIILEIVDANGQPCPPGQAGRVLVTALHSEAMPLIRYDIGDVAEWGEACDCGLQLPVIRRIWGREREFFRGPNGEPRYIALLSEDFLKIAPIRDMRLRYYNNPLLRYEIVCAAPLTSEQREALVTKIQRLLGFDCPVDIAEVPVINWGETDKRMSFAVMDQSW